MIISISLVLFSFFLSSSIWLSNHRCLCMFCCECKWVCEYKCVSSFIEWGACLCNRSAHKRVETYSNNLSSTQRQHCVFTSFSRHFLLLISIFLLLLLLRFSTVCYVVITLDTLYVTIAEHTSCDSACLNVFGCVCVCVFVRAYTRTKV